MVPLRMAAAETDVHHGSHRDLICAASDKQPMPKLANLADAIIVPTIRPAEYLHEAARLAAELGCPLVTLHSSTSLPPVDHGPDQVNGHERGSQPQALALARPERIADRPKRSNRQHAVSAVRSDIDLVAIDVPHPSFLRLPELATSALLAGSRFARTTDTSAKRNLGLVLGRLAGWRRVIFLDDDIKVPDTADLKQACALLGPSQFHAVGLANGGYPDNSVVCHAYREVGGEQDTFIGGGALAVETSHHQSLFPNIYNEDWFYLLDTTQGLQPLTIVGTAIQASYDPFATPNRAKAEEFGDVLAEGVFWLLDEGSPILDANLKFWTDFLAKRRRFVESVLESVLRNEHKKPLSPERQGKMAASLRAALIRLSAIGPRLCHEYLGKWSADQQAWRTYLERLPSGLPLEEAVKLIGKLGTSPLLRQASRPFRIEETLELALLGQVLRPESVARRPRRPLLHAPQATLISTGRAADRAAIR